MKNTITLIIINISKCIAILLILLVGTTTKLFAANQQPITQSFRITPAIVDTTLIPGQEKQVTITIDNLMTVPLGMHIDVQNFLEDNQEISQSGNQLIRWTRISNTDTIIDAHTSKQLTVTITPPKSAEKKGYYEMLFFTPFFSKPLDVTKPVILSRVGALVLAQIGETNYADLEQKVHLVSFGPNNWLSTIYSIPAELHVENTYFTHFDAKPFITVSPLFGKSVTEQLPDRHIFPGTTKTFATTLHLPPNHLFYTIHAAVSVGNGEQLNADKYLVVLPYSNIFLPILLIVLLLIIWVSRKRLQKAFHILLFSK